MQVNKCFEKDAPVYRVTSKWKEESMGHPICTLGPVGPLILKNCPEVTNQCRIWGAGVNVKVGENNYRESFCVTDESYFEVFNFQFVQGDEKIAFQHPNALILRESLACKYFNSSNMIGKTIQIKSWFGNQFLDYIITGVIKDPPYNSIIDYSEDNKASIFVSNFMNAKDFPARRGVLHLAE